MSAPFPHVSHDGRTQREGPSLSPMHDPNPPSWEAPLPASSARWQRGGGRRGALSHLPQGSIAGTGTVYVVLKSSDLGARHPNCEVWL